MNSQRAREIQVGVMVVIGVAILLLGLAFFKRINLRTDMVPYAVDIPAVEGLRVGDRVQVRGIRVGQATGFEFRPGSVRVHFEIEDWVELHEDADVALVMKGLVGEVLLEIEPGSGAPVSPGHIFTGRSSTSMHALSDKVYDTLGIMTALGEDVRLLVAELRDQDRMVRMLAAAEQTLQQTSAMVDENRAALRQITGGLAELTVTLQDALGEGKLDTTLVLTRQAVASLEEAMIELQTATQQGRALLTGLEDGEGTLGRLLTDETLYARADSTLHSLDRLLGQMRRNPKALLKMSLF